MTLRPITPPVEEPISLDEAKAQCRVDGTDEDLLLTGLIATARAHVETLTGLALRTQTWELVLDGWPGERELDIPLAPLQEVISITYRLADGSTQTLPESGYVVGTASLPGRVMLAAGAAWPTLALYPLEAVVVRFTCGYAEAAEVPEPLRLAVKLLIGHWFENREEVSVGAGLSMAQIPLGVQALAGPYRCWRF